MFDLEEDTQLIALLELRNEDYHLLSNGTLPQLLQQSLQTLYLSEPIVTTNGIIRMFYLPPLSSKIDERYQDMLANLSRYYAITCVGDLRSRQLRKGRSSRVVSPWQRNYAIVHTSGGELYQVVFQEGNKTEIQRKIRVLKKEEQVHEEILEMKGEVKVEDCRKLPGNVSLSGLIESICK